MFWGTFFPSSIFPTLPSHEIFWQKCLTAFCHHDEKYIFHLCYTFQGEQLGINGLNLCGYICCCVCVVGGGGGGRADILYILYNVIEPNERLYRANWINKEYTLFYFLFYVHVYLCLCKCCLFVCSCCSMNRMMTMIKRMSQIP